MKHKLVIAAVTAALALPTVAQARDDRAVIGAIFGGMVAYQMSQGSPNQPLVTAAGSVIGYEIMRDRPEVVIQRDVYQGHPHRVTSVGHPHRHSRRACETARAPVYDRHGRIVEFVQYCAN